MQHMGDPAASSPDFDCLFWEASSQHGYFTNTQAHACGFSRFLLARGADTGRFIRIRRGLYRLRAYPSFHREEVVAAWLALGKEVAVVSHESALDLLELSDVTPNAIHLTVPRSKRHLPGLPGVTIHTTTRPFGLLDVVERDGIRVTSAGRTIVDAAEWGTAPEQIEMAVAQALHRGLVTRDQLESLARTRGLRVQRLVVGAHQESQK
jgi:predicted transcriptional regulator of viral defense system